MENGSAAARPLRRPRRARGLIAPALAVVALLVAACGGGGGGGGSSSSSGPTTLKVGVIPIADVAPLYIGIKQGFFKQEKLDIKPQLAEGGATITAQTGSGDLQAAFSNVRALVITSSKKLPVEFAVSDAKGGKHGSRAW